MSHKVIAELLMATPIGQCVQVPRMPTLDRHAVFANVRHAVRAHGFRLSVKTDGAFHYVRRLPISDNITPDPL